jgi:hypothetical protein
LIIRPLVGDGWGTMRAVQILVDGFASSFVGS